MGGGLLFVARRLVALVVTLLIASILIYGAVAIAPGDPVAALAGGTPPNPKVVAQIRQEFHLNEPFLGQYWHWLSGAVHGDFGRSLTFRSDVGSLISSRLKTSLLLVAYSGILIISVGVSLGVLAALRGRFTNTAVTVGTTIAMGAPSFVVAIFLIWLFSTSLSWFPVFGSGSGLADEIWHLTLPAISLALAYVAYVARVTRAAVAAELSSEHVQTARSRGIPPRQILRRHVLRNASGPIFAISGLTIAGLLAGVAIAEQAFGINGIGSLLVQSAQRQDLSVVLAIALMMVTAFVVINMIVDIINVSIDPRLAKRSDG